MRTSLREIKQIEDYLLHSATPDEVALMETRLILEPDLQEQLNWQKKTYTLIRNYGRKQLRAELNAVQEKLFSEPQYAGFRRRITRLFWKK